VKDNNAKLPEFEMRVLEHSELEWVAGGQSCGTACICHVDGQSEADQQ
jgi:hypothetical protein